MPYVPSCPTRRAWGRSYRMGSRWSHSGAELGLSFRKRAAGCGQTGGGYFALAITYFARASARCEFRQMRQCTKKERGALSGSPRCDSDPGPALDFSFRLSGHAGSDCCTVFFEFSYTTTFLQVDARKINPKCATLERT